MTMSAPTWRIALASPRAAATRDEALTTIDRFLAEAAARGARIVCFPETYIPGYRSVGFSSPAIDQGAQERALRQVADLARRYGIATIIPLEWESPHGLLNAAFVVDASGDILGYQAKCQLAPEEEAAYVAGDGRRLFVVDGVPFGVVICHEGWRYPETVRWVARRGARVVFHPHLAGSDEGGAVPARWGEPIPPYFENAMRVRAMENTVYFVSVNYALRSPETATSVVAPDGALVAHTPYGEEGLLVADLDLDLATGLYARRYAEERYRERQALEDTILANAERWTIGPDTTAGLVAVAREERERARTRPAR